jgi:hypothetical protein
MDRERNDNTLYRDKLPERKAKSTNKKRIGTKFPKTRNNISSNTVKPPFKRATCSSILLSDIGQNAVVFIIHTL